MNDLVSAAGYVQYIMVIILDSLSTACLERTQRASQRGFSSFYLLHSELHRQVSFIHTAAFAINNILV